MSEVEKMYENANIKICKRKQGFTLKDCTDRDCKECGYYDMPPFTAEKQLKIMELLGEVHAFFDADKTNFACITNYRIEKGIIKGYEGKGESVSEALANLINNIWQDLTEEERKQIRGILE